MAGWETVLLVLGLAVAMMVGYWWGRESGWNAAWRSRVERK
jgi:hypothetical protein